MSPRHPAGDIIRRMDPRDDDGAATRWQVHPDVARAETLDKAFYLDPAVQTLQREHLFARSWQWLGDVHDAAVPGALWPRTLLPGCLDEPLLLSCDSAGELRCLSNVCTHRGNLLVQEPRQGQKQIRCGYHSRRFELDGRMVFMPEFQQAQDFPRPCDHLPQLAWQVWGGHAFVALESPWASFDEVFGPLRDRLGWLPLGDFRLDPSASRDYEFDAHWALYVENYLEGLHIPFVHPALTQALDLTQYSYELLPWANLQLAVARDDELAFDLPAGSLDQGRRIAAYYYWVFPNLMLNFYPWGLSVNQVLPAGPSRTRVLFRSYVWEPDLQGQGAGGALHQVEMEDEAVVMTVQQGLRSRFYQRGRYSPTREQGVHHFHRLIGQVLGAVSG
ncbi:aromatic ring-hydroxylating dioxygenase subunit alpha [Ideonella sp. DXS29W]|uniref:Aromatic ring-hydroxylating dioxygenase subunit alpha n=1 Tax=Ideonella lacteola TaxID=2984193 RepID=A0ABU9BR75_9BURK